MPSTLGIVASHVRPIAYSILPNVLTNGMGKPVTWSINANGFGTGTLYYSISNQTNAVTTTDFTDAQVSGPITITNNNGSLTKTFAVVTETIPNYATVLLRTTSTSGPIVAIAPTVTRAVPVYSSSPSYDTGQITVTQPGVTTTYTIAAQPDWNGKWFQIYYNLISNAPLTSLQLLTNGTVTQTLYSYNSPDRSITVYCKLSSNNSIRVTTGYRSLSPKTFQVLFFPQINPEIN